MKSCGHMNMVHRHPRSPLQLDQGGKSVIVSITHIPGFARSEDPRLSLPCMRNLDARRVPAAAPAILCISRHPTAMLKQHSAAPAAVNCEFPIQSDSGVPCSVRHVKICVKVDAHPSCPPAPGLPRCSELRHVPHCISLCNPFHTLG